MVTTAVFIPAILLLVAATGANDAVSQKRIAVRIASVSVTIIQAERIPSAPTEATLPRQDRQIRYREEKPLVEFY